MKSVTILILLSVVLSAVTTKSVAQKSDALKKDFLVNNAGDTIYGKFKKKLFATPTFVTDDGSIDLDPTQYSTYCTKHTLFRSIQISPNTNPQWMENVEDGKISLYQYMFQQNVRPGQPPVNRIIWLAQKNGGPILNVNGVMSDETTAKNNVSALLADKPDIQQDFLSLPFSLKNIRYHIRQYNNAANN